MEFIIITNKTKYDIFETINGKSIRLGGTASGA